MVTLPNLAAGAEALSLRTALLPLSAVLIVAFCMLCVVFPGGLALHRRRRKPDVPFATSSSVFDAVLGSMNERRP